MSTTDFYDFMVIGSGAAGAWASQALKGSKTLVIDVGLESTIPFPDESFEEIKANPEKRKNEILGDRFETLHNIFFSYLSPKLKSPAMRFVTKTPASEGIEGSGFLPIQSFSKGGLGNAWGAGAFKYNDDELKKFPISLDDLAAAYDTVTREIGISGTADDLEPFFGATDGLLPPLPLSENLSRLKQNYAAQREVFRSRGFYLGEARLAYLSRAHNGRPAYQPRGNDFFFAGNPSIYTPAFTIDELIRSKRIEYASGLLATSFEETENAVRVAAKDLQTGATREFKAKALVLAMGALNTTKFVLRSFKDEAAKLPILDNNITYLPLLSIKSIGAAWTPEKMLGPPLIGVLRHAHHETPLQMTIYPVGSVLACDLLSHFPLDARSSIFAGRDLIPAMMAVQLFYPDAPAASNYVQLLPNGHLKIQYERKPFGNAERKLIDLFRTLGLWSAPSLIQAPEPGNSIHYAGMLPMRAKPKRKYETDSNGRLFGTKRVFIADAAGFPFLPAKNHTLTIMANAYRIGRHLKEKVLPVL